MFIFFFFLLSLARSFSIHRSQKNGRICSLFFPLIFKRKQQQKHSEIVVNWGIPALQSPPAEKLEAVKAAVGDTVVFKWGGGLSYALYQISKRE